MHTQKDVPIINLTKSDADSYVYTIEVDNGSANANIKNSNKNSNNISNNHTKLLQTEFVMEIKYDSDSEIVFSEKSPNNYGQGTHINSVTAKSKNKLSDITLNIVSDSDSEIDISAKLPYNYNKGKNKQLVTTKGINKLSDSTINIISDLLLHNCFKCDKNFNSCHNLRTHLSKKHTYYKYAKQNCLISNDLECYCKRRFSCTLCNGSLFMVGLEHLQMHHPDLWDHLMEIEAQKLIELKQQHYITAINRINSEIGMDWPKYICTQCGLTEKSFVNWSLHMQFVHKKQFSELSKLILENAQRELKDRRSRIDGSELKNKGTSVATELDWRQFVILLLEERQSKASRMKAVLQILILREKNIQKRRNVHESQLSVVDNKRSSLKTYENRRKYCVQKKESTLEYNTDNQNINLVQREDYFAGESKVYLMDSSLDEINLPESKEKDDEMPKKLRKYKVKNKKTEIKRPKKQAFISEKIEVKVLNSCSTYANRLKKHEALKKLTKTESNISAAVDGKAAFSISNIIAPDTQLHKIQTIRNNNQANQALLDEVNEEKEPITSYELLEVINSNNETACIDANLDLKTEMDLDNVVIKNEPLTELEPFDHPLATSVSYNADQIKMEFYEEFESC